MEEEKKFKFRVVDGNEPTTKEENNQEDTSGDSNASTDNEDKSADALGEEASTDNNDNNNTNANDDYDESKVLAFFETKHGKKFESVEDIFVEPEPKVIEKEMELPEAVAAFNKFHKETNGSMLDFVNLNRDFDSMDTTQLLAEYYALENPNWSKKDVLDEIDSKFGYDPDEVDEKVASKIERLKLTEVGKAKTALNSMKEKHRTDLASKVSGLSEDEKAEIDEFRQTKKSLSEQQLDSEAKGEFFEKKTKELFSPDFKGFEFKLGDKEVLFKPGEPDRLAKDQMNIGEWLESFKDEKGFIKDTKAFHKALSIARNPDQFAAHFYELGKADQVVDQDKASKNIDMTQNTSPVVKTVNGKMRFRVVEPENASGRMVIKSPKS